MVGGKVIQNALVTFTDDGKAYTRRQLWCVDPKYGDECAVFVEDTAEARSVEPGDTCWWQGNRVFVKNDTLTLRKIGFSHEPAPRRH